MESIRQGADNNSKSLQANGLRQSHLQYNTARKIKWRNNWEGNVQAPLVRDLMESLFAEEAFPVGFRAGLPEMTQNQRQKVLPAR